MSTQQYQDLTEAKTLLQSGDEWQPITAMPDAPWFAFTGNARENGLSASDCPHYRIRRPLPAPAPEPVAQEADPSCICPVCHGRSFVDVELLGEHSTRSCARCDGTGYVLEAAPPEPVEPLPELLPCRCGRAAVFTVELVRGRHLAKVDCYNPREGQPTHSLSQGVDLGEAHTTQDLDEARLDCVERWNAAARAAEPVTAAEPTPEPVPSEIGGTKKHGHYFRDWNGAKLDWYRIADLFGPFHECQGHALKKIMFAGVRGKKDRDTDIQEAIDTLKRWQEINAENEKGTH